MYINHEHDIVARGKHADPAGRQTAKRVSTALHLGHTGVGRLRDGPQSRVMSRPPQRSDQGSESKAYSALQMLAGLFAERHGVQRLGLCVASDSIMLGFSTDSDTCMPVASSKHGLPCW